MVLFLSKALLSPLTYPSISSDPEDIITFFCSSLYSQLIILSPLQTHTHIPPHCSWLLSQTLLQSYHSFCQHLWDKHTENFKIRNSCLGCHKMLERLYFVSWVLFSLILVLYFILCIFFSLLHIKLPWHKAPGVEQMVRIEHVIILMFSRDLTVNEYKCCLYNLGRECRASNKNRTHSSSNHLQKYVAF